MSSHPFGRSVLLDRRRLLAAASAIALLGARPAAARQDATPAADASGEWTFVDDAGVTITRPQMPERVVAYLPLAAAFWDYGLRPVGYYGTSRKPDGTPEVYAGNVDLDAIVSLGETYGELDLEALIALQPDLIVNDMWDDPPDVYGLDAERVEQLNQIAPIANVKFAEWAIDETLARVERLAIALGADPEAPAVVEAKQAFADASAELEAAIAEKPGLTVLVISGLPDESLWVASPDRLADLSYYQSLGLEIAGPEGDPENFEELSWEQAGKYPADLFLIDSRQWSASGDELMAVPSFAALPAAQAGQFGAWPIEYVPSYQGFTPVLEELTEVIRNADPEIV